jgi:hypothetical protein
VVFQQESVGFSEKSGSIGRIMVSGFLECGGNLVVLHIGI